MPGDSESVHKHLASAADVVRRVHRRVVLMTVSIQILSAGIGVSALWSPLDSSFERFWVVSSSLMVMALTLTLGAYAFQDIRSSDQRASPETTSLDEAETTFSELIDEWHKERGATSSITAMAMCPSYQKIIGLGPSAVPLIMRHMEAEGDQPDMWFWALRVLTGADPVSDADRGNIVRMAQAWLRWGRERYAW